MATKRRLYKPERAPARKKGVFGRLVKKGLYELAPLSCPDANAGEVAKAIFALGREAGVAVGQGSGYDPLKDEYTVIGKHVASGKAQDFIISGAEVGHVILMARAMNGGVMEPGRRLA